MSSIAEDRKSEEQKSSFTTMPQYVHSEGGLYVFKSQHLVEWSKKRESSVCIDFYFLAILAQGPLDHLTSP